MKRNRVVFLLTIVYAYLFLGGIIVFAQQGECNFVCNDNAFIFSEEANTLEYDNIVGLYHSTMVKRSDGKLYVFGEGAKPNGDNQLIPTEVSPVNGYNYTGEVLKFTGAERGQFALLTTDGLYVWGKAKGKLVSTNIINTANFTKVQIATSGISGISEKGMPNGVDPENVKMLFGSYGTLGLVTCDGDAWILSSYKSKNGDGSTNDFDKWHRVKKSPSENLNNVVAMRGTPLAMMALTSYGEIYTWGENVYLGNGTSAQNLLFATKMEIPSGIKIKMIGMTSNDSRRYNSYYLLSKDGKLYSMGNNKDRQLGDFTKIERKGWVKVHKPKPLIGKSEDSGEFMEDIVWFSPQEHDGRYGAINAIDVNSKLYAWGKDSFKMIGTGNNNSDPMYMPGNLNEEDIIMAVETGGHITVAFKQCSNRYGYVGHRINGSMGDGTEEGGREDEYNFLRTAGFSICGAPTFPVGKDLKICQGSHADLNTAHTGSIPKNSTLVWYTSPDRVDGTKVEDPSTVGPGIYYAFYEGICDTPPASEPVTVSYFLSGEPGYEVCACYKQGKIILGESGLSTNVGITALGRTGDWPQERKGAWIALEAHTKGFVPTRIANPESQIENPTDGMMVYDTSLNCLRIYVEDSSDSTNNGWKCFDKQTCAD